MYLDFLEWTDYNVWIMKHVLLCICFFICGYMFSCIHLFADSCCSLTKRLFNGSCVRRCQFGFWWGEKLLGFGMAVALAGPSAPHSRPINTPTPHHSICMDQMLFLMPDQQCHNICCPLRCKMHAVSMDFPDCLVILLSISVFSFLFSTLFSGSVWEIMLTHVSFWAHVKIASRIVLYLFRKSELIVETRWGKVRQQESPQIGFVTV